MSQYLTGVNPALTITSIRLTILHGGNTFYDRTVSNRNGLAHRYHALPSATKSSRAEGSPDSISGRPLHATGCPVP